MSYSSLSAGRYVATSLADDPSGPPMMPRSFDTSDDDSVVYIPDTFDATIISCLPTSIDAPSFPVPPQPCQPMPPHPLPISPHQPFPLLVLIRLRPSSQPPPDPTSSSLQRMEAKLSSMAALMESNKSKTNSAAPSSDPIAPSNPLPLTQPASTETSPPSNVPPTSTIPQPVPSPSHPPTVPASTPILLLPSLPRPILTPIQLNQAPHSMNDSE